MHPKTYEEFSTGELMCQSLSLPIPTPLTYLAFARDDLVSGGSERNRTNCISNAKRALHLQIEIIADALGFKGKRTSFPKLVDFCASCGVVGARVLRKLNTLRNVVEHDYYLPNQDEAENFLDTVELFLYATDPLVEDFPSFLRVYSADDLAQMRLFYERLEITLEPSSGVVVLRCKKLRISNNEVHSLAETIANEEAPLPELSKEETKMRAYYGAISGQEIEESVNVPVTDAEAYCSWVSFLLQRARRGMLTASEEIQKTSVAAKSS